MKNKLKTPTALLFVLIFAFLSPCFVIANPMEIYDTNLEKNSPEPEIHKSKTLVSSYSEEFITLSIATIGLGAFAWALLVLVIGLSINQLINNNRKRTIPLP